MVRKKNINLIYDILKLEYLDKLEKKEIVNQLSLKYDVNPVTVYRNITEVSKLINQRINVLKVLRITDLGEEEFREQFAKIKEIMS